MWPRTHRIHEELIRQPPPGMTVALVVAAVLVAALAVVTALATAPYASAASRDHGASFAVRCAFSHRNSDDPIVHPGEEGAAHSHDFLGNASTKFNSTYESMITAPTTCTRPEDTAGHWIPTVKWNGQDLEAFRAVFYYRAGGKDHTQVKPFDMNLKVITGSIRWYCGRKDGTEGSKAPPTQCSSGVLGVRIVSPDCVAVDPNDPSGMRQQLDSTDHKSHMARSVLQSDGTRQCPATHPLPVPTLTVNANFPIPTTPGTVTLSSGDVSTMHADFWNTWDQDAPLNEPELRGGLNALVKRCINEVPPSEPRPEVCRAPTATA